jgi:hypothetical protein
VRTNDKTSRRYLQIGAVRVADDDLREEIDEDIEIIAMITNDVGRLLTPRMKDWVLLDAVSF